MGNNQTKARPEETLDFGFLKSLGLYDSSPKDYDLSKVRTYILERKIAPFYKGITDSNDLKQLLTAKQQATKGESHSSNSHDSTLSKSSHHSKSNSSKQPSKKEKDSFEQLTVLYKEPIECPICFLFYPRNINYSSCCEEPICTECLVQISSPESCETPPFCPYCAQEKFSSLYCVDENRFLRADKTISACSDSTLHKKSTPVAIDSLKIKRVAQRQNTEPSRTSRVLNPSRFLSLRPHRSRGTENEYGDYLVAMQGMGVELEELMIMEAIRASLQDIEQNQNNGERSVQAFTSEGNTEENDQTQFTLTGPIVSSPPQLSPSSEAPNPTDILIKDSNETSNDPNAVVNDSKPLVSSEEVSCPDPSPVCET